MDWQFTGGAWIQNVLTLRAAGGVVFGQARPYPGAKDVTQRIPKFLQQPSVQVNSTRSTMSTLT
jgi:hypothetical protein